MKKYLKVALIIIYTYNTNAQGDTPCTATTLNVESSCLYSSGTTVGNNYSSNASNFGTPSCAIPGSPDVWYKFTAPSGGSVIINTTAGTTNDIGMSLYSATNCSTGYSQITCDDDSGAGYMSKIVRTGLTSGNTYYIRIWKRSSGTGTFNICISEPPPPPTNDDPCSATTISVNTSCYYTLTTNLGATSSSGIPAPGCASYSGADVWYKFIVPSSGSVKLNSKSGEITDGGMAVYSGACGALTLVACDDQSSNNSGNMPLITLTGRTPGEALFVRFWSYSNSEEGTFSLCFSETNACGNESINDYCNTPATLTKDGGTFSANTTDNFTYDEPGNLTSIFCGTIENNSWYKFTASLTTETFNFSSVTGCSYGYGIQAEVYSISHNGSGCCNSFTSKSNCWNPEIPTTGTVTATGLTIGQDYYLMVDGNSGDQCYFTVSNWSATGIYLPTEFISIEILESLFENDIKWIIGSETNNDYYTLYKSINGIDFNKITTIKSVGNFNNSKTYDYIDKNISNGITYYKLTQTDLNGKTQHLKTVSSYRSTNEIFYVYPNPSNEDIYINIPSNSLNKGEISFYNILNEKVLSINSIEINNCNINISNLKNGFYTIKYNDTQNIFITTFIKI